MRGGLRRAEAGCGPGRGEQYGTASHGTARHGTVSHGTARHGTERELAGRRLRRRGGDCPAVHAIGGTATALGARRAEAGCGADLGERRQGAGLAEAS
jgi:hypothetical protein